MMKNFKELYISGEAVFDSIVDHIGEWCDDENIDVDLHTYLGLSEEEYKAWVEKDDTALNSILNNQRLLERIRKWQEEPVFHELTCGNDSSHNLLKGKLEDGKVVLICNDCHYKQTYIPELFYSEDFEVMYNEQKKLINSLSQ